MVGHPDFRSHSKPGPFARSGPFATQPLFNHLKTRLVRISGPHCLGINFYFARQSQPFFTRVPNPNKLDSKLLTKSWWVIWGPRSSSRPGVAKPLPLGKQMPAATFSCPLQTFFKCLITKSAQLCIIVHNYRV